MLFIGLGIAALIVLVALCLLVPMLFRKVVPTNEVHTVQSRKKTTAYGKDLESGNVYYQWPSWMPVIGITVIDMPTSIFDIDLSEYEAYDADRLPFIVDVKGFFQVENAAIAAQRVQNFGELKKQLTDILKGSIRTILANATIQAILGGRSEFGDAFTKEVAGQLSAWGVKTVKNIELMDLRDSHGSEVISNIMAKKKSEIEMDSRQTVAINKKKAKVSEIEAQREMELSNQEALEAVGKRTAEKDRTVGIANEKSQQEVKEQTKITAEKDMEVKKVNDVKSAEIMKEVTIVEAEQNREKKEIEAKATKKQVELLAEGQLEKESNEAKAIDLKGKSNAEAKRLMEMAPISALEAIAKMITESPEYQSYLLGIEAIKVGEVVGVAKAQAMESAEMKIISNAGSVDNGMKNVMDIMTPSGGTSMGAMLDAFSQTETGKELLDKVMGKKKNDDV